MNNEKILSIFLTILMVGSVFAFASPATAQDQSVSFSLQPSDGEVVPGEEQTFELVIEGMTGGLGSYDVELDVGDSSLITIDDVRAFQTSAGLFETTIADDGSSAQLAGLVQFDAASQAVLAEIDIAAADVEGSSSLDLTVNEANTQGTDTYTIDSAEGANVEISEPDREIEATEVRSFTIDPADKTLVSGQAQHFTSADFDQDNIQLFSEGNPTQQLNVNLDVEGSTGTEELVIDYGSTVDANVIAADFTLESGPLSGAVVNTEVRNSVGELVIEFDTAQTGDVVGRTQTITVEFTVDDPAVGVDPEGGDDNVRHAAEIGGVGEDAFYRLTARGATAISAGDGAFDLADQILAENVQPTRQGGTGAFRIWQDQQITFQVPENTDALAIFEYDVESQAGEPDQVTRGSRLQRVGTAPGAVKNYDTSQLEANERYIIDFVGTQETVIIDVDPLNLNATAAQDEFVENRDVRIDVSTADVSGSTVEAFFLDENFNFLHSEQAELSGDGSITVRTNATENLEGIDDYNVVVEHLESEVSTAPEAFSVVESPDEAVTVASPRAGDDSFARGDIIPIELEFENTDIGTLTFGDRTSPQNLEVHVTVEDTNEDGTATIYLNTFQLGDGARTSTIADEEAGLVADGESCEAEEVSVAECTELVNTNDNRNHGFFTLPGDEGVAISGQAVAHGPSLDIEGGSTGGAVVFPQAYDLVTTSGETNYKAEDQFLNDRSIARIQEGTGDGVTQWTAPGLGENEIDPEFAGDITSLVEDGIITPADGQVAAEDFLILQLDVTGLEGIMHEAVLQDDDLDVDDFLDREDDHLITEEFFAAQNLTDRDGENALVDFGIRTQETLETVQERSDPNEALDPVLLDIQDATTGVVSAADDSGNLQTYYIPIRLEPGTDLSRAGTWFPENVTLSEAQDQGLTILEASGDAELDARPSANPQQFHSTFTLDPSAAQQQNVPANDPLANGFVDTTQWDYVRGEAFVNDAEPILVVPQEDGVEISGTTTVAAGTNLTINLATTPAEDPPFFKQNPAVFPEFQEGGLNTWTISEDFADFEVGTSFEITIRRTGAAGQLTYFTSPAGADPAPVPGSVGEVRAVGEFTFNDQDSGGQSVVVQSFQAPYDSVIQIQDANGNVLGTSDVIPSSDEPQTRLAISLDQDVTENQELTAVALVAGGIQYPDAQRSAQITVEEPDEAEFAVSGLEPQNAELEEPGPTVTVSATVTNEGDLEATQDVAITVDGEALTTQSVTLAGGEETTVSFDVNTGELAFGTTYIHGIASDDDEAVSSLTIAPEPTPEPTPTETATPEPTETETPEDSDDGAGFGIVVAMLAFLGAALLAVRRRVD